AESLLRSQAEADPAVLRGLMQRYPGERDAAAKSRIRSVLASINKPEVIGFATQLAASGDPATRREGLEMLQHLAPDSPEVRKVVRNALATEQSPDILVAALGALGPAAAPSAESDGIVTQLRTLAQHADPTVRSQSVLQLAQWDKSGSAQATLSQALADPSAEVRQAAVFALAQSNIRSDSAKAALLAIAGNANESRPLRGSALQALERFEMSKEEHAVYSQARSQVLGF
ncbi:MAG TPA: HEAT repeat domain-containing protein, partial [Albitalea sp.]|nr:HEAT repeat domain-containing protein [Albitalea sp.]